MSLLPTGRRGFWGVLIALWPALGWATHGPCAVVWSDEFDGPDLASHWQVVLGDGCDQALCGWGNNEQQTYAQSQIQLKDGLLGLTAAVLDDRIVSGKIESAGAFSTRFGRIEARMKMPQGRGLWSAFWMLPEGATERWPLEGEIDIAEWTGNDPNRIIGAAHFGALWPNNVHYSETWLSPRAWHDDFHVFGIDWQPNDIRWFVDGREHGRMTPELIVPYRWVFNDLPFYLILNLAVGGTLGGEVVREDFPATLWVDWVRVFDAACFSEGAQSGNL